MSILNITIFYSLIQACQNCHMIFKLGMMIPDTVRQNVESVATQQANEHHDTLVYLKNKIDKDLLLFFFLILTFNLFYTYIFNYYFNLFKIFRFSILLCLIIYVWIWYVKSRLIYYTLMSILKIIYIYIYIVQRKKYE